MRDYSKPFYDLGELTAAFNGICKRIGMENFCCSSVMPLLGECVSSLAKSIGVDIAPTGDIGTAGINLQQLIDAIIEKELATKEELRSFIDAELLTIPKNPLINFFEY